MGKIRDIAESVTGHPIDLLLHTGEAKILLSDCSFRPVPDREGSYKVVGSTRDLGIVRMLPELMLGPSTEFARLKITGSLPGSKEGILLYGHVTSSMQRSSLVQLHIEVDEAP